MTQDRTEPRAVLVTGSSRGIGRAIALRFAGEGAHVVVHYKRQASAAEAVAREVEARGGTALVVQADLEDGDQIARLVDAAGERLGRLDVVVSNAAATVFRPILELKEHHIDRNFALNVKAFILLVQRAVPLMTRGGNIVAISSYGSMRVLPGYGSLGMAKAAVETLVRYLACELAPRNITVNAVIPGVVATDSADFYFGQENTPALEEVLRRVPQGRAASPEEVAEAVAFLCSPGARYITGAGLVMDGGLTLVDVPAR